MVRQKDRLENSQVRRQISGQIGKLIDRQIYKQIEIDKQNNGDKTDTQTDKLINIINIKVERQMNNQIDRDR